MATFTINDTTADRLMKDLNKGRIVKLTKANGSALILQHGNDIDEFGDYIYRFTIESATDHNSSVKNVPMNETDMIGFINGLEFTNYETLEA